MATSRRPKGSTNAGPVDPRAEFFTLAGLAALGSLGVGVSEKTYRYLKSPEPFVVQVLRSFARGPVHVVEFAATNQTIHGLYIEKVGLSRPESTLGAVHFREQVPGEGLQFSSVQWVPHSPTSAFPKYIGPGESLDFAVELPLQAKGSRPYGELKLWYSRLDDQDPTDRKFQFRLRS